MAKDCIECKVRPARYWGSSFCEECFKEVLKEKLENDNSPSYTGKSCESKNH
ncbi:hypothetical protein [Heyndrickxia camelliae]|uniref:hypothetical protein n=1 Tax=Heyndrickxia camelliae TaxID=1707093 RepID=UPI0013FD7DAA|nr:hypothetical protein [Heyndrickxia camelliae]